MKKYISGQSHYPPDESHNDKVDNNNIDNNNINNNCFNDILLIESDNTNNDSRLSTQAKYTKTNNFRNQACKNTAIAKQRDSNNELVCNIVNNNEKLKYNDKYLTDLKFDKVVIDDKLISIERDYVSSDEFESGIFTSNDFTTEDENIDSSDDTDDVHHTNIVTINPNNQIIDNNLLYDTQRIGLGKTYISGASCYPPHLDKDYTIGVYDN